MSKSLPAHIMVSLNCKSLIVGDAPSPERSQSDYSLSSSSSRRLRCAALIADAQNQISAPIRDHPAIHAQHTGQSQSLVAQSTGSRYGGRITPQFTGSSVASSASASATARGVARAERGGNGGDAAVKPDL